MRGMVNPMMGTARSAVEGRERSEPFTARRGAARRPSTMLRMVPLPCKTRGGALFPPLSTRHSSASWNLTSSFGPPKREEAGFQPAGSRTATAAAGPSPAPS
jgi:hypothetical protein